MWKGRYYEELMSQNSAEEILSTLLSDLQSMQAPGLVHDQLIKFSLTEKTAGILMGNKSVRQQLVYIVDKGGDSELQELFSFFMAIYNADTRTSESEYNADRFKSFLSYREKKYGKNAIQTYTARKCYIKEISSDKKEKGFKLLRKNFEILLDNPEAFPYGVVQEEAKFFLNYYSQTLESKKSEKAYKIFRSFIDEGRRICPNSTFTRAIEKAKF